MVVFYQFLRLFLLFYVLCSTSFVNLTGFYTEDEPNFIISYHFDRHMLPILTSSLKHHIFSCFSDGSNLLCSLFYVIRELNRFLH